LCCETEVPDFETDPREYFAYLRATEESSDREFRETGYDLDGGELKIYYVHKPRFRSAHM